MIDTPYNIFGSKDSIDVDIVVFVSSFPNSIEDCKNVCRAFEKDFLAQGIYANCNIAVIKDGIIVQCFKGTTDEVNNAVLATYDLWKQKYPCQVLVPVKRNVEQKIARALRSILTYISHTQYRDKVKKALKSDASEKIDVLVNIDFSEIECFNKNNLSDADCWKGIVFQMFQTHALMNGDEIYTKSEARNLYPEFKNFINREEIDKKSKGNLNKYMKIFCETIRAKYSLSSVKE